MATTLLLFALPVVIVAATWLVVPLVLGVATGWRALARSYRGQLPEVDGRAKLARGWMQGVRLKHAVTFTTGPAGIGMALFPLFALGNPPLAIPWQAVDAYQADPSAGKVTFRVEGVAVTATGAAAQLLDDAWQRWGSETGTRQPAGMDA
ncbi:MAG TPA: hypothetical protein VFS20_20060 [Longimicrobium sp.]|nr:hypothetical protein [Longimicrobium sp.]